MKKQQDRQPFYEQISLNSTKNPRPDQNIPDPRSQNKQYPNISDGLNQQLPVGGNYDLKMAGHPMACIFTFLFKGLAIVSYFFAGLIFSDVFVFILVTVLSGMDFWVVKNVTGRLLVGLRWWSDFTQEGKEIWVYESFDQQVKLNAVDSAFFWTSQLGSSAFWLVFLVMKVLSFSFFWGILVLINFVLSITNLYGFYKCRGQHSKKLSKLKEKYAKEGLMHFATKMF